MKEGKREPSISKIDSNSTPIFLTDKGGRMVSTHPRRMDSDCGQSKFKNLAEGYSLLTGFNNSFEINFKNLTDEKILKI